MPNLLITNNFYISSSSACIVDLTPPTFSGINFLDVESRGQIRAGWSAASDATAPIRYEVYIQANTAVGLFSTANIIAVTPNLQYDIFTMPDGSFLVNGTTYFVGVRAIDGVNNRDSNVVSMDVISTGVLTAIDTYETLGAFSLSEGRMFQGTIWAKKNLELCTPLNATLGTASYQVYDKNGVVVSGMSQSGITSDVNGQFKITPVSSLLNETLEHYIVKVTIEIDSEDRHNYIPMIQKIPSYKVNGNNAFDTNGNFIGIFWAEDESHIHINDPARLGVGSYDVIDKTGSVVVGFGETGLTPNAQGVYIITPVSGVDVNDLVLSTGRVSIVVDGITRTTYIPVNVKPVVHIVKSAFAINALNQLIGTLWIENDDSRVLTTTLGTASYEVFDASGIAVVGLSQTGIAADANGRFIITPVSAVLLTDLTLYTIKVTINAYGLDHTSLKGISLLGN